MKPDTYREHLNELQLEVEELRAKLAAYQSTMGQLSDTAQSTKEGDTISRQAAIDAVEFGITYAKAINKDTGEAIELFKQANEELRKAVERINQLPSAQPEQQWIPCSERLPEEDLCTGMGVQYSNSVLMTIFDKSDEDIIVDYGHTRDGEWYSETADEFVECIADWKVIAWMPLPEPYAERRTDE